MAANPYLLGAVAYDPKVVTIWEGFKQFFARHGFGFDYVLYSNYERQVEAHLAGHFDVAWNSPLAWIRADRLAKAAGREARAVAMRDSDQDLTSVVVARAGGGITSAADLRGKTVGVGALDSPQATLLPLLHLAQQGLEAGKDFQVRYFDVLGGKHGDHIGGERDAARALVAGEIDAACMIDGNHLLFAREGTFAPNATAVVAQTAPYDHCNFTVLADGRDPARFVELLMAMSYADPEVRPLLDLEGLKAWRAGRVEGYRALDEAATRFGFYDANGAITAQGYRY